MIKVREFYIREAHTEMSDCLIANGAIMMQSAKHLVSFNEESLTASCGLLQCKNIKKS